MKSPEKETEADHATLSKFLTSGVAAEVMDYGYDIAFFAWCEITGGAQI